MHAGLGVKKYSLLTAVLYEFGQDVQQLNAPILLDLLFLFNPCGFVHELSFGKEGLPLCGSLRSTVIEFFVQRVGDFTWPFVLTLHLFIVWVSISVIWTKLPFHGDNVDCHFVRIVYGCFYPHGTVDDVAGG